MYGPAVRCKSLYRDSGKRFASMYPASIGGCRSPGHHGYQRACDLISGQASTGPFGSPVFAGAGKTEPPSRFILSQTSAGKSHGSGYVIVASSLCAASVIVGVDDQADWAAASSTFLTSKARPRARTLQAMRASLLASAIASTLRCSRFLAASIQDLSA
jgi:hypothetical protein